MDDIFNELETPPKKDIGDGTTPVVTTNNDNKEFTNKKDDADNVYTRTDFKPKKIVKDTLNKPAHEFIMIVNEDIDDSNFDFIVELAGKLIDKGMTMRTTLNTSDCKINDIVRKVNQKDAINTFVPYKGADKKIRVEHNKAIHPSETAYEIALGGSYEASTGNAASWFSGKSDIARAFQARTIETVLGEGANTPAKFLLCFSADGADSWKNAKYKKTGNCTGYITNANFAGIPIFNLGKAEARGKLVEYVLATLKDTTTKEEGQ